MSLNISAKNSASVSGNLRPIENRDNLKPDLASPSSGPGQYIKAIESDIIQKLGYLKIDLLNVNQRIGDKNSIGFPAALQTSSHKFPLNESENYLINQVSDSSKFKSAEVRQPEEFKESIVRPRLVRSSKGKYLLDDAENASKGISESSKEQQQGTRQSIPRPALVRSSKVSRSLEVEDESEPDSPAQSNRSIKKEIVKKIELNIPVGPKEVVNFAENWMIPVVKNIPLFADLIIPPELINLQQTHFSVLTGQIVKGALIEDDPIIRELYLFSLTLLSIPMLQSLVSCNFLSRNQQFDGFSPQDLKDYHASVGSSMEKLQSELELLDPESHEYVSKILNSGKANCGGMSLVLYYFARKFGSKGLRVDMCRIKNGDHGFIILNSELPNRVYDVNKVGKRAILIDPWALKIVKADDLENMPLDFIASLIYRNPNTNQVFHLPVVQKLGKDQRYEIFLTNALIPLA